ncbi:MAG TPA: VOC family protein, partial [Candidatus Dormibacteraeota bacterium]|nr:VOC family protein [Candidatus Dormibacteraeota bacterium]
MSHIADGDLVAFVATIDFNRARAFYGDVLGLPLVDENPFALVYQAQNARLRVTQVDAVVAAPYTVLGWFVPDIMAALHELENHGVRFERVEGIGQD